MKYFIRGFLKNAYLLTVFFLCISCTFLLYENSYASDFKIIKYGIRNNKTGIIDTITDSIPLKRNINFGIEVSFPSNKYTDLIVRYKVPQEMECKPDIDGYKEHISGKNTFITSWKIESACEMVPGNYTIEMLVDNNIVASKDFKVGDLDYEYGIFDNNSNDIIRKSDIVPLQKNISFGAKIWFPYNKYKKLKRVYKVPNDMSCKPDPNGYLTNLSSGDISQVISWKIVDDCEMVPGKYEILGYLDDVKKMDLTFDVVSAEDFYSINTYDKELPRGFHLIKLGMTLGDVYTLMGKNKFKKNQRENTLLFFSPDGFNKYEQISSLVYEFQFEDRPSSRLGKSSYREKWAAFHADPQVDNYFFDGSGLSFIPLIHRLPDSKCNYPTDYLGGGDNFIFGGEEKLISFEVHMSVKPKYRDTYADSFKAKIVEIYGPSNAHASYGGYFYEAWVDGKTFLSVSSGFDKNITIDYADLNLKSFYAKLNELESVGERLKNECIKKLKSTPVSIE